jgi:hypothetical protein
VNDRYLNLLVMNNVYVDITPHGLMPWKTVAPYNKSIRRIRQRLKLLSRELDRSTGYSQLRRRIAVATYSLGGAGLIVIGLAAVINYPTESGVWAILLLCASFSLVCAWKIRRLLRPRSPDPVKNRRSFLYATGATVIWLLSRAAYFLTFAAAAAAVVVYNVFIRQAVLPDWLSVITAILAIGLVAFAAIHGGFVVEWLREKASVPLTLAIRVGQPGISDVIHNDSRRPILLLRAFSDDVPIIRSALVSNPREIFSLEEVIADRVSAYGPLIAIGEPDTLSWPGGATRDFYPDDGWQNAVISWMNKAFLVTLIASGTAGLAWELKALIARGHVGKLLISLPGGTKQDDRWHAAMLTTNVNGALAVHFCPDGNIAMICSQAWSRAVSEVAIDVAIYGMYCRS